MLNMRAVLWGSVCFAGVLCSLFWMEQTGVAAYLETIAPSEISEPTDQTLFLLDTSSSMNWPVRFRRKIAWMQEGVIESLRQLPVTKKVGLQTFGGSCHGAETLVPMGNGNHDRIRSALQQLAPSGTTPLAYALEQSARTFNWKAPGRKTILVLTDGAESCGGNVCAAVRRLQEQSLDLQIDVMGILLDDAARRELACLTELTGGTFFNLNSGDLPNVSHFLLSLGGGVLKRIIVLGLGLGAIAAWSHLMHRALVSTFIVRSGIAATLASIAGVMALAFFSALLFQPVIPLVGIFPLPVLALGIGIAAFVFLFRREKRKERGMNPFFLLVVFFAFQMRIGVAEELREQPISPATYSGRDHIIAIDQSGSMRRFWPKVQERVRGYVATQVQNGDLLSLFSFTDVPVLVETWRVSGETDREEIARQIDTLRPVPKSYTVFSRLLPAIIQHLRSVASSDHDQVVLVFSDGKSSHPPDFQGEDIPLQAIGEKILRVDGFLVAATGGKGLNLAASKGAAFSGAKTLSDTSVIKEWKAVFSPRLSREEGGSVVGYLSPSLFGTWPDEVLMTIVVTSTSPLPKAIPVEAALVSVSNPSASLPFRLSLTDGRGVVTGMIPVPGALSGNMRGTLVLSLPQHFASSSLEVPLEIRRVSWGEQFWWLWWSCSVVAMALGIIGGVWFIPQTFGLLWLTSGHGEPVALSCRGTVMVGGTGGLGPENLPPMARLLRGHGRRVFLEPLGLPGTAIKLDGVTVTRKVPYVFGRPLLCCSGAREEQLTISRMARPRRYGTGEESRTVQNLLGNDLL